MLWLIPVAGITVGLLADYLFKPEQGLENWAVDKIKGKPADPRPYPAPAAPQTEAEMTAWTPAAQTTANVTQHVAWGTAAFGPPSNQQPEDDTGLLAALIVVGVSLYMVNR